MASTFLTSANEITSAWLEEVPATRIVDIAVRANAAFNSSVVHLELTYPSTTDLPRNILVKMNREHDAQSEIQFYRLIESMNLPMIPSRLGMEYEQSGLSYLLLDDLSKSHTEPVTREQR